MDLSRLCANCFNDKRDAEQCPHCGYKDGDRALNELHLSPGTILRGQYMIGRVLGYGGFGVTYLAYDLSLQALRAIKEYFPGSLSGRSSDGISVYSYSGEATESYRYGLEKFVEEGRMLAKFSDVEAIVSVYDYFIENNTAYLVMEYLNGMDLSGYLKQRGGKISWQQAQTIFKPVMQALSKIHMTGLIHRDISPDNIFITSSGKVKLIDFGAARQAIGEKSESLSVILKPGYAPPEQYHTRGKQGPWTDVYALGATLYRALTGVTPTESLTRVMNDDLKPLSEMGIQIPRISEMAIAHSLNLDENARFKTMDAFYKSLFEGVQAPKVKQKAALIGGGESFSQKAKLNILKPLYIKITTAVLSVTLVCVLFFTVVMPLINYNTAVTLFNAEKYEQASDVFRGLGKYKDSVMMLARSLYRWGTSDYANNNYSDAIKPFTELSGDYPDNTELKKLPADALYMDGVNEGAKGDFDAAIAALEQVGNYENAQALITAAQNGETQPFLDELAAHQLPVTENDVESAVSASQGSAAPVNAPGNEGQNGGNSGNNQSGNNSGSGNSDSGGNGNDQVQSEKLAPITIKLKSMQKSNSNADINLFYPEISGLKDSEFEENENSQISDIIENLEQQAETEGLDVNSYYYVERNDGLYVSIVESMEIGQEEDAKFSTLYINILNSDTGKILKISDLVKENSNYVSFFNNKIRSYYTWPNYNLTDDQNFYLTDTYLELDFKDPGTPKDHGIPNLTQDNIIGGTTDGFELSFSDIPDILRSDIITNDNAEYVDISLGKYDKKENFNYNNLVKTDGGFNVTGYIKDIYNDDSRGEPKEYKDNGNTYFIADNTLVYCVDNDGDICKMKTFDDYVKENGANKTTSYPDYYAYYAKIENGKILYLEEENDAGDD